ncbi:Putative mannose-6-phosphate isomerase YvyI [Planctomycetes bacterium Poly30]|uniref:Mannose-6-phosphate isomerase YvyI n=1 Tax=Saltatorellus ferox TaxID=2528018 RepID=A0A518EZA7_9BACT|nr:Putative mannose-6-phosphate isomerase YvyI [Planctomycetes bacterium Poly30]
MSIQCPLRLLPVLVTKVWGGEALRPYVAPLPGDPPLAWRKGEPVGEVWIVSDRGDQSSKVASGPFQGRTLQGLMLSEREALVGESILGDDESFPLLLKLLDAQANLSVQVHPDDRAAAKYGGSSKDECWFILDAAPRAEIFLGLAPGVDATRFAAGATTPEVVHLLQRYPVSAGDGVHVPSGTVHSIGAGIAIVEVQTNSDTTYRLYDWGRTGIDGKPRETHLEESFRSMDYDRKVEGPGPLQFEVSSSSRSEAASARGHASATASANRIATLARCKQFVAEVLEVHEPVEMTVEALPTVLVVLAGSGRIDTGDGEIYPLVKGGAWVLPADLKSAKIVDADGELKLVRARPARA